MADVNWTISVVQMDCALGDIDANIDKIAHYAGLAARVGSKLVVCPECCTTGYFVGERLPELIEAPGGPMSDRLGAVAKENGIYLAVGSFTLVDNQMRNSQLLFSPEGELIGVYHKAHLFAGERENCVPGDELCLVDTGLGRLGMTICYDLIFPGYVRNIVDQGADLIINSTNWINDPYQREVWDWSGPTTRSLAAVRALENGTFVAMANRIGEESLNAETTFRSFGHSCIAGPSGKILASITDGEGIATAHIDISEADMSRWKGIATYRQDRRPELYG